MKKICFVFLLAVMTFLSCRKEIEKPTVQTKEVDKVAETSAVVRGSVSDDGGGEVTSRGFCYGETSNPTIDGGLTAGSGSGVGGFERTIENLEPNTVYYVRAYAINEAGVSYGEEKSFKTEEDDEVCDPDGEIFGHGYVDLGLPSGKKWATCNVGASSPEDYGDYFAWGETSPKAEYTSGNSITYGEQMSDISGNAQYDAATANWGGSWRMPTKEEMQELVDNCTWEWTQVNGVNGAKVIGPNGSCIFLPAAGWHVSSLYDYGDEGHYWSSTPYDSYVRSSYFLEFYDGNERVYYSGRYPGYTVRPITE